MAINFAPAEVARAQAPRPVEKAAAVVARMSAEAKVPNSLMEVQKRVNELRDHKAKHGDPREGLSQAGKTETPSLSPTEIKQLDKIDPKLAKEAAAFDTVSSVQLEAQATKKSEADVIAARGAPPATEYEGMKKDVVDRLMKSKYVQGLIPGIEKMDPQEARDLVEAAIVSNDLVRQNYLEKVRVVVTETAKMPVDPETSQNEKSTSDTKLAKAQKEKTLVTIQKRVGLTRDGKEIPTAEIDALFEGERTPAEAAEALFDTLLTDKGINPVEYRAYRTRQTEITRLSEEQKNAAEKDRQTIGEKIIGLREENDRSAVKGKDTLIGEAREAVYGHVGERGQVGGVESQLQELANQRKTLEGAEGKPSLTPDLAQTQEGNNTERERLGRELSKALTDGIEATMLSQYDELTVINGQKFLADAEDQAKLGEVEFAKDAEHLNKVMSADGSHLEHGKRVFNMDKLSQKLHYVIDHGKEDGGTRSMLYDVLTRGGRTITVLDAAGKEVILHQNDKGMLVREDDTAYTVQIQVKNAQGDGFTAKDVDASTDNISLGSLTGESKKLLDHVNSQRDVYLRQLQLDYQLATSSLEMGWNPLKWKENAKGLKANTRLMALTDDQRGKLVEEFGMQELLDVKSEAQKIRNWKTILENKGIANLEGIGMNPLLMFLMLLGYKKKED